MLEESNGKELCLVVFSKEEEKQLREQTIIVNTIKKSQKIDLAFLVDCTGSMDLSINIIKSNIKKILQELKEEIFSHFQYRLAFVGYRDYGIDKDGRHVDNDDRIVKFDFSSKTEDFEKFLSTVEAKGGGDECEDVFGGS